MKRFKIKTEVCFSENAIDALSEIKNKRAVIITDSFMSSSGAAKRIADKMTGCTSVDIFDQVRPDPPIEMVVAGVRFLTEHQADVVVALGGGSSIDAAKGVVLMMKKTRPEQKISLIAIPTTSGTGSEVTEFAVITDKERGIKYPLVDEELLPDMAILDPSLVVTAPPSVTADTGFDVITHALEAYVSTNASDASDALAEKALELAFEYLPKAYKDGNDLTAREKMHSASCLAGMAFNAVSLGVNHGIAHQLGAKFHIPHGRANAMLLPYVIEFNADVAGHFGEADSEAAMRYAKVAGRIGLPCNNVRTGVKALIDELSYMLDMMKVPRTLSAAGVKEADYNAVKSDILRAAVADPCTATNPRPVDEEKVELILNKMLGWSL